MKLVFLSLCTIIICSQSLAQKKSIFTVKAGNNIMDVMPASEVFLYPQFTAGTVFLRNGSKSEARLNYSRLVDEIHFINVRGDTLALADEENIRYIVIQRDTFFYEAGYIRLLATGKTSKLAAKDVWMIADTRQLGAMNTTSTGVQIISFKTVHEGGRLYDLTVNEDVIFKRVEVYYFGDEFNRFVAATKQNILSLFPKKEDAISKYLKANKTNFKNKSDVENLLAHIENLGQN